jgi:NAD(P) transhydrogenase subunit beta
MGPEADDVSTLAQIPAAVFEPGGDAATALYIVAFSLFIIGVRRGTHPTTAKQGNLIAAGGMAIAVVTTLLLDGMGNWGVLVGALAIGSAVGVAASLRVQMTQMPQMVALYNGVGGGAVALIAWSEIRHGISLGEEIPLDALIPILFSAVVGSISFWGSNIAFAKLQDLIPTRPLAVPGQQVINALLLIGILVACVILASDNSSPSEGLFIAVLIAAALLGNLVVLPIGGADMPVVISLLNAFTGLAAAAAGFALDNVALIVAGTLVGSSGTILTMEMATAMNRSVGNILFAGFGGVPSGGGGATEERPHVSIGAQDAAIKLAYADSVVIVPGYGLAVAQAQHAIKEVADELEKRGVTVGYAIHPVAGRMPGHMNVLLAEADVPYEQLKEMEEINPELPRTDVAVVVGANDVTNPAAKNDPDSPIAGMPIIEVNEAQQVIVIKRSLSPGFAGIDNDLFYEPNTSMLFADAKQAAADIAGEIQQL